MRPICLKKKILLTVLKIKPTQISWKKFLFKKMFFQGLFLLFHLKFISYLRIVHYSYLIGDTFATEAIVLTSGVAGSRITRNSIRKSVFMLKINWQSFYCLKWNMLLVGVVYLIFDTYYYFIIPIREWTYKFIGEWTCT